MREAAGGGGETSPQATAPPPGDVLGSRTGSVPLAQWLEHCISSAKVVGSIPREHTYITYFYVSTVLALPFLIERYRLLPPAGMESYFFSSRHRTYIQNSWL